MAILAARPIVTPFGKVTLPEVGLPPRLQPAAPDERAKAALRQALGEDLTYFVGLIPVVGALVADAIGDIHHREVVVLLSDEERKRFMEYNKFMFSTLAVARTLLFPRGQ